MGASIAASAGGGNRSAREPYAARAEQPSAAPAGADRTERSFSYNERAIRRADGIDLPAARLARANRRSRRVTSSDPAFALDPRLAADGPPLGDLPLCHLRLVDDARFLWVVLVPRRANLSEIIDLDTAGRTQLMEEIALVSSAVKAASGCAKLNVAALGNVVPQLHVHVVARDPGDAAWPGPVFGAGARQPLKADALAARLADLRGRLPLA